MTKRELALDLPAIRERVAEDGEMWLGLSRDEAELMLAEIDRTAAALAAVQQDRDRITYERDQYRAESQRLGNQAQHLVNRVTAERERANEAARLSAAARDANDDLLAQVEKAREQVSIVEESRMDLVVENDKLEQDRERLRAERDLAIAHDRQPYPTAWAYEQACKTIERMRPLVEAACAYGRADGFSPYFRSMLGPFKGPGTLEHFLSAVDTYESEMEAIAKVIVPAPLTDLIGIAPDRVENRTEADRG